MQPKSKCRILGIFLGNLWFDEQTIFMEHSSLGGGGQQFLSYSRNFPRFMEQVGAIMHSQEPVPILN
jgi:hypothetical protein